MSSRRCSMFSMALRNARYAVAIGTGTATLGLFLIWVTVDLHPKTKPMSVVGWFSQHVGYFIFRPRVLWIDIPFVAAILFYSVAAFVALTLVSFLRMRRTNC
jgi:hypothetical protein